MKELPDIADMVVTVRDFLARLGPTLDKGGKFEAQVAVYLLDIVTRELAAPAGVDADNNELCAAIRSGARDSSWDTTLEAEFNAVIARVRIVKPDYLKDSKP